jgi:hypothetical protein
MGLGGQRHAPAALPPGRRTKERIHIENNIVLQKERCLSHCMEGQKVCSCYE